MISAVDVFFKAKLILLIFNTIFSLISIGVVFYEHKKDGSWLASDRATGAWVYMLISPQITWAIYAIFAILGC